MFVNMNNLLKRNRIRINKEINFHSRKYFSPSVYADSLVTISLIIKYVNGKHIDIGCGDMPFKMLIEKQVTQYDTLDTEKRAENVTYIADVCNMDMIKDATYDSAICLQVLEHVADPFKAMREVNRILKKGSVLVCSVPHLSRLHEEPHDYYRYTKYGLEHLFKSSGFRVVSITPTGGLFCFLGHQLSSIILLSVWHIPILKNIAFWLNKWAIVKFFTLLDSLLDKNKIFALGYSCVVEKSESIPLSECSTG